jgi:hypothetical protein
MCPVTRLSFAAAHERHRLVAWEFRPESLHEAPCERHAVRQSAEVLINELIGHVEFPGAPEVRLREVTDIQSIPEL